MASKTEISNRALSKLGSQRVTNVETENVKRARVINAMYDEVRDAVLQAYPWNFAIKRTSLSPDGDAPAYEYTYAYTIPSDFLGLIDIYENPDYSFENGKILTNEGTVLYIRYIAQITSTGSYSPVFVEAFATRLAYEACEELTQSNTKKQVLLQQYERIIGEAYQADSKDNPINEFEDDDWVSVRL